VSRARNTLPDSTPTWPTAYPNPTKHAPETCPEPCFRHPKFDVRIRPSRVYPKHAHPGIPQSWALPGIPRKWSIPAIPGMAKLGTSGHALEQASGHAPRTLPGRSQTASRTRPGQRPGHVPEGIPDSSRRTSRDVPEGTSGRPQTGPNGRKRPFSAPEG
jgi:hypothetical protein